jgi:predicted MPP superfamily phosphohydrolase
MRALPFLAVLVGVQVGLYLSLRDIFLLGRRGRRLVLAGQLLVALFFVGFMRASRAGVSPPALVRVLVIEPLLSLEALAVPLMLLLGLALTLTRRLPRAPGEQRSLAPEDGRRVLLVRSAKVLLGTAAAAGVAGIAEAELAPEITRHEIPIRGLHPDLDGVTIVQLSDIHAGALMSEERMRRIAQAAKALSPDLVVFTGDLLDVSAVSAAPFSKGFEDLHGRLGTFAVLGNHDYFAGVRATERAVRDAGGVLLRNSGARIERGKGSLFIGGVDDLSRGGLGVDPRRALRAAAPEEPKIMLAHRPMLFEFCASAGAQLVLSGHTHGGQFALSRKLSMARILGPYTMGSYQRENAQLYVHRGMGTIGPVPMRLGSPPEIALLTLRKA